MTETFTSCSEETKRLVEFLDCSTLTHDRKKRFRASVRERKRRHVLNNALDRLKRRIPISSQGSQKMSKVEILRLAINYITLLSKKLSINNFSESEHTYPTSDGGTPSTSSQLSPISHWASDYLLQSSPMFHNTFADMVSLGYIHPRKLSFQ